MNIRRTVSILSGVVVLMALLGNAPAATADGDIKIGVVDLQRCLNQSTTGKRYKAEFTAEADRMKADLEGEEKALKALREELESQGLVLSETARVEKEKVYKGRLEEFKQKFQRTQKALQTKDQELTRRVLSDLQEVIRKIGETEGYTLVLEGQESGVLYAPEKMDITDAVIRLYDQKMGSE